MAQVRLENLTKRFGEVTAVDGLNLEVNGGELLAIVGPSGCGKTTLLRLIAGLERPDEGTIHLENELVSSKNIFVPPYKRRVGMVFQNYALWPHMNIFGNVAYPLKVQRLRRSEIRAKVEGVLALVQLEGLGRRYPHELSGGEQQRAALARALVMEPRLLLLDEPLNNLDAKLREEMREELKRIQREIRITMIYVTHDQAEAMALADRIGVMESGRLIQLGPPREVYEEPGTEFVARFIGASNLVSGDVDVGERDGRRALRLQGGVELPLAGELELPPGPALLAIRPEEIIITRNGPGLPATIKSATYLGNAIEYRLTVGDLSLRARTGPRPVFNVGEQVFLKIRRVTPIGPPRRSEDERTPPKGPALRETGGEAICGMKRVS